MKKIITSLLSLIILLPSITFAAVHVSGYFKSNGTYVAPYYRTSPDSTLLNNYSTIGNFNPYTGKEGTINPYSDYGYTPTTSYDPSTYASSYVSPVIKPTLNISYPADYAYQYDINHCNASFLRNTEKTECNYLLKNKDDYNWNVATVLNSRYYAFNPTTGNLSSCPDGYKMVVGTSSLSCALDN